MDISSFAFVITLALLSVCYKKHIHPILFSSANSKRSDYFKKINRPEDTHKEPIIKLEIDVFREHTFLQPLFITTGSGTKQQKSSTDGRQHLKKEHSLQKKLFCETQLTIFNPKVHREIRKNSSDIFNEIFTNPDSLNVSELIIVSGRIGCGKSTIINNWRILLYEYYSHSSFKGNFVSIYIDVRDLFNSKIKEKYNFTDKKIASEFEKALFEEIKNKLENVGHARLYAECISISDLARKAILSGDKIYIFLDELDVLYYEFCKFITNPNIKIALPPEITAFYSVLDVIFNLSEIQLLDSRLGLFKILVAVRTSSYKLFFELYNERDAKNTNNTLSKYRKVDLDVGNWQALSKYLEKKLEVAIDELKQKGSEANQLAINNFNYIKSNLSKIDQDDFDEYLKLSVHGIRHSFKLFNKLLAIDETGELFKLVLFNPKVLRVFQYIDGSDIYSQTREGVSNLFLINSDYVIDLNKKSSAAIVNKQLLKPHLHTYWLKILIIKYFYDECTVGGRRCIDSNEIYEIFCETQDSYRCYEEELVTLIIFHLTEARHGRMLTVMSKDRHTIELYPTSRIETIFKGGIEHSFSYLMVVIEDEWLQFPKYYSNDFKITKEEQRTSNFVKNIHKLTDEQKYNFIFYKAKLVLQFVYFTNNYYGLEKARYKNVFKKLKGINRSNWTHKVILKDVEEFSKSIFSDESYLKKTSNIFSRFIIFQVWLKSIFYHYLIKRNYCYPGCFQSMEGMMKKYYESRNSLNPQTSETTQVIARPTIEAEKVDLN